VLVGANTAGTRATLVDAGLAYNASTNALTTTTFIGALQGNASTASTAARWTTARTITLSGDVSGTSPSWSGNGNLSFSGTVVADDSHQHTKYTNANFRTGSYTLTLTDKGDIIDMNVASSNNLTIPPNSSVAFPVNTRIDIYQYGAGKTSIVAGAGVTLRGQLGSRGRYKAISLWKRAVDEWAVLGGGP
jgi:hypothetical protein